MALPSTGSISFSQINVEIKRAATNTLSLNDATVRKLAGRTSGSISMSHLRGKSYEIRFVNSTNRTGANIYSLMGSPKEAGIYIFENTAVISAGSGSYALRTGTFPAGSTLRIINRGTIRGRGGAGGANGAAGAGGTALYIDMNCTLDNAGGTISGGGGGGSTRRATWQSYTNRSGGGGGAGSNAGGAGANYVSTNGWRSVGNPAAGTATGGGAGGRVSTQFTTITGGSGGARGAAGGTGSGSQGSYSMSNLGAGAAGRAIARNGKTVTIINAGTRHGATS